MRKAIFLGLLLIACAGLQISPCILHTGQPFEEFAAEVRADPGRKSYIIETGDKIGADPCKAYRVIELASKEGIVFQMYSEAEFDKESNAILERVKNGLTFGDFSSLLAGFFLKYNKAAGAQIFIATDLFLQLPDDALIPPDDAILIEASIIDAQKEVHKIAVWLASSLGNPNIT